MQDLQETLFVLCDMKYALFVMHSSQQLLILNIISVSVIYYMLETVQKKAFADLMNSLSESCVP